MIKGVCSMIDRSQILFYVKLRILNIHSFEEKENKHSCIQVYFKYNHSKQQTRFSSSNLL